MHRDVNPLEATDFKEKSPVDFQFLNVDLEVAYLSAEIMANLDGGGKSVGFADVFIAATAIQRGLVLATSNSRHFERIAEAGYPLVIENWRESFDTL